MPCNAVDEITELDLERFSLLHAGGPHVARAIAHQQVVDTGPVLLLDALVVYLDLFVGLEIVPHQHLFLAADQRRADLDGREPVDVDVGDRVAREVDGEIRNVHEAIQVGLAGRDDGFGLRLDEKVHDRQIVRRQIPDHADVVLEESQVDPCRIVVVEVAEDAVVQELAHLSHGAGEEKSVVHHDRELLPLAQLDQLLRLAGGAGEGFFDEDMLPIVQGGLGQLEVRRDGGHDGNRIDLGRGQQVGRVRRDGHARVRLRGALQGGRVQIADTRDLASLETPEIADDVRAPVAVADNSDADHGMWASDLVGAVAGKHGAWSLQQDLEVEPERPRLRIFEVE